MHRQNQRLDPAAKAMRRRRSPLLHTAVIVCLTLGAAWAVASSPAGCSSSPEPAPKVSLPPKTGPDVVDKFAGDGGKSGGGASVAGAGTPDPAPSSPARAEEFEKALRAGDAQAATACIMPAYRKAYEAMLMADPATTTRAAELLATRKLVAEHGRQAQYEVTEGGKTYPVIFEKIDGRWFVVAF